MDYFAKIFYAILLIGSWVLILKYRRVVKSWTGNFYWAERYLWRGWTYFVLTIIAIVLIFIWILYPFWWLDFIFWKSWDVSWTKLDIKK